MGDRRRQPWKVDKYGYPIPDLGQPKRDMYGRTAQQRRTIRQQATLANGRHPLTMAPLLDDPDAADQWGYKCRDCAHAFRYRPGNRTVWKCQISFRMARGSSEATDLRVGWPACTRFRIDHERAA